MDANYRERRSRMKSSSHHTELTNTYFRSLEEQTGRMKAYCESIHKNRLSVLCCCFHHPISITQPALQPVRVNRCGFGTGIAGAGAGASVGSVPCCDERRKAVSTRRPTNQQPTDQTTYLPPSQTALTLWLLYSRRTMTLKSELG